MICKILSHSNGSKPLPLKGIHLQYTSIGKIHELTIDFNLMFEYIFVMIKSTFIILEDHEVKILLFMPTF